MANIVVHESPRATMPEFRFTAVDNDRESELTNLVGFGPTAEAAVRHLLSKLSDRELEALRYEAVTWGDNPDWREHIVTVALARRP